MLNKVAIQHKGFQASPPQDGPAAATLSVLFGADSLQGEATGIGRHTAEIVARLARHSAIGSLRLLSHGQVIPAGGTDEVVRPMGGAVRSVLGEISALRAVRNAMRRRGLQRQLRQSGGAGAAIYHEANMIPVPFDGPCTVTVHDLFWCEQPGLLPRERLRWIERNWDRMLHQARGFACVSAFTAAELRRRFPIGTRPVVIAPNAAARCFQPMAAFESAAVLSRYGLLDRGYILSVSTREPRKNLDRLWAAHRALPPGLRRRYPLVIVGASGWGDVLTGSEQARRSHELLTPGFVPAADLPALVARAAAVAMVSLYEGFGLPVIEAMAAGTPVLAAATTGTGETAGMAASLVDPLDIGAMTAGLRNLLEDEALWAERRAAGLIRATAFSWDESVERLIGLWREVGTQ